MEASKLRRFFNWLIDSIGVLMLLAVLVRLVSGPNASRLQLRLASMALLFVYYVVTEFFFQRSLGKLITSTAVVDDEDEKPDLGAVLLRTACRFIPLEPLSLLFHKRLAWHDRLSSTKVVFLNY